MAWSDAARKAAAEARRRRARPKAPKIYGQEVFGGQLMYRTDPSIKYGNMAAAGYHRTYGLDAAKKQGFGKKLVTSKTPRVEWTPRGWVEISSAVPGSKEARQLKAHATVQKKIKKYGDRQLSKRAAKALRRYIQKWES